MFENIVSNATSGLNQIGFGVQQHTPGILVAGGIIGVIASTVMACKATTKASCVSEKFEEEMNDIHEAAEKGETRDGQEYTEEDMKKDKYIATVHAAWGYVKIYAVPALTLALSVSAILGSHYILNRRNIALGSAYLALDQSFREYKRRVAERYGEEVEYQIAHGIKVQEIEEEDEKGKKVKKKVEVADPNMTSPYCRYFTRSNPYWEDNDDFVKYNLAQKQTYFNDKLRATGHVTLNEVYDALGFHETQTGMVCGWIYDTKCPNGDNYIEFAIKDIYLPNEYTGALEKAYTIDFNVDGNIFNRMPDPKIA